MQSALKIHVSGVVQGVGFRPFVYRQAKHYLINGWVMNCTDGVHIHAEGEEQLLDEFCLSLANDAPAAATVEEAEMREVPLEGYTTFEIRQSQDEKSEKNQEVFYNANATEKKTQKDKADSEATTKTIAEVTLVSPDLATCEDCVSELFSGKDRRYRYPFINCTNCGPRFTIIDRLPYDRASTSMADFEMCADCNAEYNDPADRRFHAQPDACFECGPSVSWMETDSKQDIKWGTTREKSDAIFQRAVEMLLDGKIVAIKGLGGFHLACDASNEKAVANLRKRKERSNKAFAVMTSNFKFIKEECQANKVEERIMNSPENPIVLLKKKNNRTTVLAENVTNGLPEVGVMLPYTPVQHILLHDFIQAGGKFLVMTSGNLYDNPILIDDEEAYKQLGNVADAFLGNNRRILIRYDDTVLRVLNFEGTEAVQYIRRARGVCPLPQKFVCENSGATPTVFATGPEQKNTFCYARPLSGEKSSKKANAEAFVSQYIGDVENAEVFDAWIEAKDRFENIFKMSADEVVCDMHPEYLTTKWAREQERQGVKVSTVQHHFAHIASVMAENNLHGPVLGFAFDGTGYGADGKIWGGEALLCNRQDYERFANLIYFPMPGGQAAIKNPLQMAAGVLWACDLMQHPMAAESVWNNFTQDQHKDLIDMIEQGINTPYTSSFGRLFDAVSAILGVCKHPTYEGEGAIMLEAEVHKWLAGLSDKKKSEKTDEKYTIELTKEIATENSTAHDTSVLNFDPSATIGAVLDDLEAGVEVGEIAKNFHDAIAQAIVSCARLAQMIYGIDQVALSGGVFMNRYLMEAVVKMLTENGLMVALNLEFPPNDGNISFGQAVVALEKSGQFQ